jgi:hypothetical protein
MKYARGKECESQSRGNSEVECGEGSVEVNKRAKKYRKSRGEWWPASALSPFFKVST